MRNSDLRNSEYEVNPFEAGVLRWAQNIIRRPNLIQACGSRACQVSFGLAQFRAWWGGLLQFQTLFSNFNLHIRTACGISLSAYPAIRKKENAAKIAAIFFQRQNSLHSNFPVNLLRTLRLTFSAANAITYITFSTLGQKLGQGWFVKLLLFHILFTGFMLRWLVLMENQYGRVCPLVLSDSLNKQ